MEINELVQPATLEEAYRALTDKPNSMLLGGCAFLRMGSKQIGTAIDLGSLGLDYITETADTIEIGAMATFRSLETHSALLHNFDGILPKAVGNIIGVQFRNIVTVGASVFSKYGFSDVITALLALDTEVELFNEGCMTLAHFLDRPYCKDILTKVRIKKDGRRACYQQLRNSASDYPILNAAVAQLDKEWTIVVGARPLRAQIARQASAQLSAGSSSETAAHTAAAELVFGSNMRGTKEYRQAMCKVLVQRAIEEVRA